MPEVKITFCNRAYADAWYKNLKRQNPPQFTILQAIITEIQLKDGGEIVKGDMYRKSPEVERIIDSRPFDVVPSRGQMLRHNGNGIRHAKFAPSKSIAVVWEKIGDTVYVTFDDHAPVRYHRAIAHLREIKLGLPHAPKRPRNSGKFLKRLRGLWKYGYYRELHGFCARGRYYR